MADGSAPGRSMFDVLDAMVSTAMALALATVLFVVLLQVLFRYILSHPLAWTQELAQYAFIWMVYLGAGLGVRRRIHLRIDLLEPWLAPRRRRAMVVFASVVSMLLALVFLFGGAVVAWLTWPHRSPAMGLPMGSIYLVFPISGLLLALCLIEEARNGIAGPAKLIQPTEDC